LKIVDTDGWYVSESTIFRALKREGLIKPAEIVGFKAAKEYHRKTKRANELWGHRLFSYQGCRLGLVLPGDGDGRL